MFLGRKRENHTLVLRTAISVPGLLSVSRLTTCATSSLGAGRLRWAGSSLGWDCWAPRGSPGSVADGPMILLAPTWLWLSCCSSEWPWAGGRCCWWPQGCQWGKAGLGTDGHSPGLTAGTLRGRGIEESGEKTSLGKGLDGRKVVI